jgi:predicted nucleotidyltransferase
MYLDGYISSLKKLCQVNKVKSLYVFGSVLTDKFNENSDIDLLVDIDSNDPFECADNYFNLKLSLQELFKRPVDLLENKSIANPFIRQNIDSSKFLIFATISYQKKKPGDAGLLTF